VEVEVRRHEHFGCQAAEDIGKRELRLKRLVADLSLDSAMSKDINSRKW
jgi:hypothetical protein